MVFTKSRLAGFFVSLFVYVYVCFSSDVEIFKYPSGSQMFLRGNDTTMYKISVTRSNFSSNPDAAF